MHVHIITCIILYIHVATDYTLVYSVKMHNARSTDYLNGEFVYSCTCMLYNQMISVHLCACNIRLAHILLVVSSGHDVRFYGITLYPLLYRVSTKSIAGHWRFG